MKKLLNYALAFGILAAAARASTPDYEQSFSVGALQLLNVKVSCSVNTPGAPALAALSNRFYLDGYNRVDSSGNLGEGAPGLTSRTGYFGFTNDSQVNLTAGTISMHDLLPPSGPYYQHSGKGGQTGMEVSYQIVLKRPHAPEFGLDVRAGWIDYSYATSGSFYVPLVSLTDTYQLGGVVPPPAPYSGAYKVAPFTPRIGDTPTRSISQVQALAQGRQSFDASGWLFRAGGVCRLVDTKDVALELHGGPALLWIKGSFNISEGFSINSVPALVEQGSASRSRVGAAGYFGSSVRLSLGNRWGLTAGADMLDAGHFTIPSPAVSARFDFTHAILANLSADFRF